MTYHEQDWQQYPGDPYSATCDESILSDGLGRYTSLGGKPSIALNLYDIVESITVGCRFYGTKAVAGHDWITLYEIMGGSSCRVIVLTADVLK